MVDVGIDSKEQILDHEPHPGHRRIQRQLPGLWKGRSIPLVMSQERFTVEIGKCHDVPAYPVAIVKFLRFNPAPKLSGNLQICCHEYTAAVATL